MTSKANVNVPGYQNTFKNDSKNQLFWFVSLLIIIQLIITYTYILSSLQCYDKIGLYLFPLFIWVLFIFGVYFTLENSPGFTNAFSDVIGYYYVYSKVNKIMSDIETTCSGSADSVLLKEIKGDSALLFNSMTINNFETIWEDLKINKEEGVCLENKQELLNYVIIKNKIGEICWYIWTSIVAISVVSYYISTIDCEPTIQQVRQNQQDYQDLLAKQEDNPEMVYAADAAPDDSPDETLDE